MNKNIIWASLAVTLLTASPTFAQVKPDDKKGDKKTPISKPVKKKFEQGKGEVLDPDELSPKTKADARFYAARRRIRSPLTEDKTMGARELGRIFTHHKRAVPLLAAALEDKDWRVRKEAANSLSQHGKNAEPALGVLLTHMQNSKEDWRVKAPIAVALAKIGPKSAAAIPQFQELIGPKNAWKLRLSCGFALTRMGPTGLKSLPKVIQLMKSKAPLDRELGAIISGEFGPRAASAIPHLITLLEDSEWRIQSQAISALGLMGEKAAPSVDALTSKLGAKD
ncbi:MAG: HEAT repeat domain-containing protein, partial [Planctomycetota bacterium]|nr:HEAT repeat domain-containing protein [Planctomycetota bacterium]